MNGVALALALTMSSGFSLATLEYRGPTSKTAAVEKYSFSQYEVGSNVRCAVDGANLRPGPGIEGDPVAQVPFGAEVEILEVASEPVRVQDRVDRWYRVKTPAGEGHLFGNTLTPLFYEVDLDDDGKAEQVTVAYTAKLSVIVRVFEPHLSKEEGRIHGAVLKLSRGKTRGGVVRAAVHPRTGGLGVVEVQECVGAKCHSGVAAFVKRKALGSGRVKSKAGASDVGWRYGGVTLGGWKNLFTPGKRTLVRAQCASCRARTVFVPGEARKMVDYEIEAYPRAPSAAGPCEAVGALEGGSHDGAEVISCPVGDGGKGGPEYIVDQYFALQGERWVFLGPGQLLEDLRAGLKAKGIKARGAKPTLVAGLEAPTVLRKGGAFGALKLVRHDHKPVEVRGKPVFVDAGIGPVYAVPSGYAAPHPHKGAWLYDWEDGPTQIDGVTYAHVWRGESAYEWLATHYTDKSEEAVLQSLLKSFEAAGSMWKASIDGERASTVAELRAQRAVVIKEDDFGRRVALIRHELIPPMMAEPIVYLWPERELDFTLRVDDVKIASAWPPARANTWVGRATPAGELVVEGERHDRLFWEGFGRELPLLDGALIVTPETAAPALESLARRAGLEGREVAEFVEAWAPRAARMDRAQIRVMDPVEVAARVPLVVEPRPDTELRFYIELSHAPDGARPGAIAMPSAPARSGFVVVEWGGIERP
jgi:hypothetical protein